MDSRAAASTTARSSNLSTASTTTITEFDDALGLIRNRIRALRKKHARIFLTEQSLSQGKSPNKEQQELLRSKPSVAARLHFLAKLFDEISSTSHRCALPLNPDSNTAQETIKVPDHVLSFGSFDLPLPDHIQGSSQNDNEIKERYLCISDGFEISCLKLELRQDRLNCSPYDIPSCPIISTLRLPEKGLPILMGLFKLGADAYTIGGRKFEASKDRHRWFMNIFSSFSKLSGLHGSSRAAYRLSLVDGNLSLSECDFIKPLNQAIAWPIVEKIGDEIHVIESFPTDLFEYCQADMTHHEALNLKDLGSDWIKLRIIDFRYQSVVSLQHVPRISAHLVVGDCIYAKAKCPNDKIFIFDCKTHRWGNDHKTEHDPEYVRRVSVRPSFIDEISEIFEIGTGRCVGGFLHGEFGNSLYVIFAIIRYERSVHAVAYLVAVTGQILCFQRVPHFFDSFLRPDSVIESTVIKVDEEGETMCAIVDGKLRGELASRCLFINTFTVVALPGARSWIRDLWRNRCDTHRAIEQDFVRVVVEERYVYSMPAESDGECVTRMQACFL